MTEVSKPIIKKYKNCQSNYFNLKLIEETLQKDEDSIEFILEKNRLKLNLLKLLRTFSCFYASLVFVSSSKYDPNTTLDRRFLKCLSESPGPQNASRNFFE